ncbi:Os1348 family NHLP clan protein [Bradyrhizobium sp. Ce-3]|uniref:Os1348 family NHLP clan protein n=1 Tax=Bradyrhizobium sp. Ce-3 TaxID=2913970 RepID=UPI001FC819E9|nr:Os1348 family NHLP clan protein [Bradyrhizobium sp. Ce-3]
MKELLARALLDDELRARLFADPGAVARELDLAPAEARALTRLDHIAFEQRAARLRQV